MARDLRLQITGDSKSAERALDNVADESDKAAVTLRGLAAEMKQAARDGGHLEGELKDIGGQAKTTGGSVYVMGRQFDKAAEEMRDAARAAEKLDHQLGGIRGEIARLNKELAASDNPDDVVKALKKQYTEYDKISRVRKRIAKDEDDARKRSGEFQKTLRLLEGGPAKVAGGKLGILGRLFGSGTKAGGAAGSAGASAAEGAGGLSGVATPVGAAIGASALPAIGSLAGAALLGGGALAGIGLGVAGAVAGNPEAFQKKWSDAIAEVTNRWKMASLGFEKPALQAFDIIKNAIDRIDLEGPLKSAEKYVVPLSRGIAGFITPLANGIGKLVEKAGPVVAVLAKDLPALGKAFEMALGDVGDSADGAALALHDLIGYIGIAVIAVGKFIKITSELYKLIRLPIIPEAGKQVESYGRTLHGTAGSTDELAKSQESLSESMKKVNDAVSSQLDSMLALDRANDAAATGVDRLKEAFKENGNAIDGNSEKARKNRDVLQGVIDDYLQQRDAAIAAGDGSAVSLGKANAVLRKHLEDLRAVLIAHGDDTTAVDKYLAKLDSLDGKVVTVKVNVKYQEYNPGIALGNLLHHARGGEMPYSGFHVVGEHGPELQWASRGAYTSSTEETRKLMSMMGAGAGNGAAPTSTTVSAPPMSQLEQAFAAVFMYLANRGVLQVPGRAVV